MPFLAILLTSTLLGAPADDHDKARKLVADVTACRTIADAAARLQCYDTSVSALADANDKKTIIVADRDSVRLRRPSPLAGPDGVELEQLTGTVAAIGYLGDGRVTFTLANGTSWNQSDDVPVPGKLKPGGPVTIKHGALGSFIVRLGNRPGFKAKPVGGDD
jgi:hypothetical protein